MRSEKLVRGKHVNIPYPNVSWWARWCTDDGPEHRLDRATSKDETKKRPQACMRNRFETLPKLKVVWNFGSEAVCSVRTTYRRLVKVRISSYTPVVRIPLSSTHTIRKNSCSDKCSDTCSDKSKFTLNFLGSLIHVHRHSQE